MNNIVLITADDLNYNSLGYTGCKVPGISPNLDRLAFESMYFANAHVSIAVCQPSRSCLLTGRYPHKNGAVGFNPIYEQVQTLTECTRSAGCLNGIIGKANHLEPEHKFCWDYVERMYSDKDLFVQDADNNEKSYNLGRNPVLYYQYASEFIARARKAERPFFLMVNSNDPHRPFAGSDGELERFGFHTRASRIYQENEIEVPGFLPDLGAVRKEAAQYYTSVHRADETVGEILRAIRESGLEETTAVFFLSDNGMAFPFAKANCYFTSTKTPLLVRWKNKIKPAVDTKHFVSGIDFMPTALDIMGIGAPDGLDGKSYLQILMGGDTDDFSEVFTMFHITSAGNEYPMRAVLNGGFGYILNLWSDGTRVYQNESQSGLTFRAMCQAGEVDSGVADRVQFFERRCVEELYDFRTDPDALHNLSHDNHFLAHKLEMRGKLLCYAKKTGDAAYAAMLSMLKE